LRSVTRFGVDDSTEGEECSTKNFNAKMQRCKETQRIRIQIPDKQEKQVMLGGVIPENKADLREKQRLRL
jgi:hypothetical protein